MEHAVHPEAARPDFAAFEAAVRARLPQHHALPPEARQGVARLGRLVQVLRTKQRWSLQALATRTGLPWLWLALLEQGMLLPAELTAEALHQVGQAFLPQPGGPPPAVLFRTIAEHLRHLHLPSAAPPAPSAGLPARPPLPPQEDQRQGSAPAAERPPLRDRLVRWLSPLWQPLLAGELVTAADTAAQEQVFLLDEGQIRVTCEWRAAYRDQPAILRIAWHADIPLSGDFWVRFTRRDDPTVLLAEVALGRALEGEEVFSTPALGFDPTREPWALTLVLKASEG